MGYQTEYIVDLQWEVDKLTEIKDKFKARARHYRDDYQRVDDAATYWKGQFEDIYNRLVRIVNTPGEEATDGECIDAIYNLLYSHEGQSDEQIDIDITTW